MLKKLNIKQIERSADRMYSAHVAAQRHREKKLQERDQHLFRPQINEHSKQLAQARDKREHSPGYDFESRRPNTVDKGDNRSQLSNKSDRDQHSKEINKSIKRDKSNAKRAEVADGIVFPNQNKGMTGVSARLYNPKPKQNKKEAPEDLERLAKKQKEGKLQAKRREEERMERLASNQNKMVERKKAKEIPISDKEFERSIAMPKKSEAERAIQENLKKTMMERENKAEEVFDRLLHKGKRDKEQLNNSEDKEDSYAKTIELMQKMENSDGKDQLAYHKGLVKDHSCDRTKVPSYNNREVNSRNRTLH